MNLSNAPVDLQVGDYVDLEGQIPQVKIVVAITPQGLQLRDPLSTLNQNILYPLSRVKGFRTSTKLKEYSNPTLGYIRRVRVTTQNAHQLKQKLKQIMADPVNFSPKELIQTLRGRHYYYMHSLMMNPIESEEAYLSVTSYLALHRDFFITYILRVDFSSYEPNQIYSSSMNALCSCYHQLIQLTEIAAGVASEFNEFRKSCEPFYKKEKFQQEVHEWFETQLLVNFVEALYPTFPAQFIILLLAFVSKIVRSLQIQISEPLGDFFETLYSALLSRLQMQLPPSREIITLNKMLPTLFKALFKTQNIICLDSLEKSKIKASYSSQTEKLESCDEQVQGERRSANKMREQAEPILRESLKQEQFSKVKQFELKLYLALSYLKHGNKESCFSEINACMAEITRQFRVKEEVAHLKENWPRIGVRFFELVKQKGLFEELLKINNFISSVVSVRSILIKFYHFLPRQISTACIAQSKASVLKQVLSQRPSFPEEFYGWLVEYICGYQINESQIKDLNELIKYLGVFLKGRHNFESSPRLREMLLEKQFEMATLMKDIDFSIFDNLFSSEDEVRVKIFRKYLEKQVFPRLDTLLDHFNEFALYKYTISNSLSLEQFELMLRPMLAEEKEGVIYERRKMSIINILNGEFHANRDDKAQYLSFLRKFIDYYTHPAHKKTESINNWSNYSVYPATTLNKKIFLDSLPLQFCEEVLPKMFPFSSELDICLANEIFCKLNHFRGKVILDEKLEISEMKQIPDYWEEIIQGYYYLGKQEIKTLQRYVEIYSKAAHEHVFYQILEKLLQIIIKNQAAAPQAHFLYKKLKCRHPLSSQHPQSSPADYKIKFTNFSLLQQFLSWINSYQNDPYRAILAEEHSSITSIVEVRNTDSLLSVKLKLSFRANRQPCEIILLDKDGNNLPTEIEKRTMGNSVYLFADENNCRQIRNQGKVPVINITFKTFPQKSPAHQSLLRNYESIFMLLPKTVPLVTGIDMRIEQWTSFDRGGSISGLFERVVKEGEIPDMVTKSPQAVSSLLDYFLWRKSNEQLSSYNFCSLLSLVKKIDNQSDTLHNLKLVYLIHISSNFKEEYRDQLLSALLFLQSTDIRTNCLDEQKAYEVLTELVYKILERHPKGALEFYFTTDMVEKFSQIDSCFSNFKHHWKTVYQDSNFEEKIELFKNIEDRFHTHPENMKQLGSLIDFTKQSDLVCLYETTLQRMARHVIMLNKTKVTGHLFKICCYLLTNCWEFLEKDIRCDYIVHKQFVFFLRDNFYEYAFHITQVLYGLISHCMSQPSHQEAFINLFRLEISQQQWHKRQFLEGGRRYRQPQSQGYVGLVNCFNTCYANSLFQQLYHNEHFSKELLATDWPRQGLQKEDLILQLKKIFINLKECQHPYENRAFFDSAFKLSDGYPVETTIQMDVDEFRNLLFNHLQEIIPKNMFWSRIFEGKEQSQIKCLECQNVSSTEQTYNSICLSVQDFTNLESSLEAHHKPLILENDNAYFCEKCNRKVSAQKSLIIKSLPPCLIFVLKRFQYVAERGFRRKLNNYFEFPLDEIEIEGGRRYSLKGIISHMGYSQSGHYISYLKLKGQWYQFNDARVRQLTEEEVKSNSYGSLRGSQRATMTERTAYLLFYESLDHPFLETAMQVESPVIGVETELQKIRLERRLLNKEIAFLNHHFLSFLSRLVQLYPSMQTLNLLFLGLVQIAFKVRIPESYEAQLYQDNLVRALQLLADNQNQRNLSFIWNKHELQRTISLLNSSTLIQYKASLVYLLAQNSVLTTDDLKEVLDWCLTGIYQARIDVSSIFAFLHYISVKHEAAAQYLHQNRIVGRILDLTFVGMTSEETRSKLKASSNVEFERTVKFQPVEIKEEMKYHKWALLVHILSKYQDKLDESQEKYMSLQQNASFMQRVIDQCRTKPTMHYVSQYFCLLIKRCSIDFANKVLGVIRDGVSKEKGDGFRRYIVLLEYILSVKCNDHEAINKNAVNILYKMLQNHTYANDNTFEYLWLWFLKILNGNEVLRKQVASNRNLFEFLYYKPYTSTAFYRSERSNILPIKTRHRLHNIPVPITTSEFQLFHNKKIQNTKAILSRIEHPSFTTEMVREQLTVEKDIYPGSRILKFYDVTQQFEEYIVLWAIGDLLALATPIPKEKYPNSVFLLKGDERVLLKQEQLKEQQEVVVNHDNGLEGSIMERDAKKEQKEEDVKREASEE